METQLKTEKQLRQEISETRQKLSEVPDHPSNQTRRKQLEEKAAYLERELERRVAGG